jgi:hypothetical protein
MATIGQRVFVSLQKKYLTLANEEFVRRFSIGNTWNQIRLGVMFALTPNGTSSILGSKFVLGVCSGKTNPYAAASTTNFVGFLVNHTNATTGQDLTYNANSGNPYYSQGTARGAAATRVNTTVTQINNTILGGISYFPTNTGTVQRRGAVLLDITKGSPNYTVKLWDIAGAANMNNDYQTSSFLNDMESPTPPSPFTGASSLALAASETPGVLDTFDLFWNKASFPVEIYAIAAFRFA